MLHWIKVARFGLPSALTSRAVHACTWPAGKQAEARRAWLLAKFDGCVSRSDAYVARPKLCLVLLS